MSRASRLLLTLLGPLVAGLTGAALALQSASPVPAAPPRVLASDRRPVSPAPEPDQIATAVPSATPSLSDLWDSPDPTGSRSEVALRFMQALQRHDDLAAAFELTGGDRMVLSGSDLWHLRRVMRDVRWRAGLDGSGSCRRARVFDDTQVLVACGALRVMVRSNFLGHPGVTLYDAGPDRYRHAHTRAYSSLMS